MAKKAKAAVATQRPFSHPPSPHSQGLDMSQVVKFPADFYDQGVVKFVAGHYYPLNSETQSLVNTGYAELLNADDPVDHVEVLTALVTIASDRAIAAQTLADELKAAAHEAQSLLLAAALPLPETKLPLSVTTSDTPPETHETVSIEVADSATQADSAAA
jgi:hypothetical protein